MLNSSSVPSLRYSLPVRLSAFVLAFLMFGLGAADGPVRLSGSQAAVMGGTEPMPDALYSVDMDHPAWVSADHVFTAASRQRSTEELPLALPSMITWLYDNRPTHGCFELGPSEEEWQTARSDLRTALSVARNVLLMTLTGKSAGFQSNQPGTLFRGRVDQVLKGNGSAVREHYLFIPAGELQLPELQICKREPDYPRYLPGIGDQFVVLTDHWSPSEPYLYFGGSTGFISLGHDGRVSLPQRYRLSDSQLDRIDKKELLALISSVVKGSR